MSLRLACGIASIATALVLCACGGATTGASIQQNSPGFAPVVSPTLSVAASGTAYLGDDVCSASMQQNSIALSASGAPPVHDKTTVISWTFHDLVAPFQTGNFDAYLASYQGRPTWVVEVRNLNHPWENGHGRHPRCSTYTISLSWSMTKLYEQVDALLPLAAVEGHER